MPFPLLSPAQSKASTLNQEISRSVSTLCRPRLAGHASGYTEGISVQPKAKRTKSGKKRGFLARHSLSIACVAVLILWTVLYTVSSPKTHWGSFFGNAIADWSGVVVTVLATKYLYERGSAESREPPLNLRGPVWEKISDHSLTLFLLLTGLGWVVVYMHADPESKWGQVAGNILSEWTQILALVILTKRLIETHSKESEK
jgi:hypothetical protein